MSLMLIVMIVMTVITGIACLVEAWHDGGFPTGTFKYFAWFACCLLAWIVFVGT